MRQEIMDTLRFEFDGDLAAAVKVVTFKTFSNSYSAADGVNTRTPADSVSRGLVNGYKEAEVTRSAGAIDKHDLKVTFIADEVERPPVVDDVCDIGGVLYRARYVAPDSLEASYVVRMGIDNG